MPRTRPAYGKEFGSEAVQLLFAHRTLLELAESVSVYEQTLRNWRRQAQFDRGEHDDKLTGERAGRAPAAAARASGSCRARSAQAIRGPVRDGDRDP
jgi:transposase-like protein